MVEAAEAALISARTAHKWLKRFDEDGPTGLLDHSSRPLRSPTVPFVELFACRHLPTDVDNYRLTLPARHQLLPAEVPITVTVSRIVANAHWNRRCELSWLTQMKSDSFSVLCSKCSSRNCSRKKGPRTKCAPGQLAAPQAKKPMA